MNIFNIEDIQKVEGGIDKHTFEHLLLELIEILKSDSIEIHKGVESLSDLIALRENKTDIIAHEISTEIISWLEKAYNSNDFKILDSFYDEDDLEAIKTFNTLDFITEILYEIGNNVKTLEFLQSIIEHSHNEVETYELNNYFEFIKEKIVRKIILNYQFDRR